MPLTVALVAGELMETIVARIQGGTERLALTAWKSFTEEVAGSWKEGCPGIRALLITQSARTN
jgi:hypothetical protein